MRVDRALLLLSLLAFSVAAVAAACLTVLDPAESAALPRVSKAHPPSAISYRPTLTPTSQAPSVSPSAREATTPALTPTPTTTLPPMPALERILLLGSDEREASSGGAWLMNAIMVVTLDSEHERIGMLGIPRDLWVSPPTM